MTLSQTDTDLDLDRSKHAYWDDYYSHREDATRPLPSQFATFVAGELEGPHQVIEFGCGNGRDSLFFAAFGHSVVGVDGSGPAVEHCQQLASALGEKATFVQSAIDEPGLAELIPEASTPTVVYARFFLHAITEEEEQAFFRLAAGLTSPGDTMAVEYRTVRDTRQTKVTGTHYRRFMDPHAFHVAAAEHGFTVTYAVEGFGFAKYKQDDAYVARCLLKRA